MTSLKTIELEIAGTRDLALLAADDSIWLVVPIRWWDLSTIVWWLFCPADRSARVKLTVRSDSDTRVVSFRAVRVASRHVRVGAPPR
jgi:hypothetical protein